MLFEPKFALILEWHYLTDTWICSKKTRLALQIQDLTGEILKYQNTYRVLISQIYNWPSAVSNTPTIQHSVLFTGWSQYKFWAENPNRIPIILIFPIWTVHRGAFCQFHFRWIYYCHSSKLTGKKIGKTHLCAVADLVLDWQHRQSWVKVLELALCVFQILPFMGFI